MHSIRHRLIKGSIPLNSSLRRAQNVHTYQKDELLKYLSNPPYTLPNRQKIVAPPMVYIGGEEMTNYAMNLM
jgi:hypothetical protein